MILARLAPVAPALLLTGSTLAAAPPAPAVAVASGPTVLYAVHKGDTLYALSRIGFPGPAAIRSVQRLNRIPDPRRVLTGRTIAIPRALLTDEQTFARVESFSGEVVLAPPGGSFPARTGAAVGEGTVIRTERGGFVSLRLADESVVTLPSQSAVRIVRLRRVRLTGAIERIFAADAGRVRARVTPMPDPASSFEVRTPLTVAAVRGTAFRVSYDPATSLATAEVEEGKVAVAADKGGKAGAEQLVTPGLGTRATAAGTEPATALLAAPHLVDPDAAQTASDLHFRVEPVNGASAYRVQVARDAGLLDLVAEGSAPGPEITLPGLATGTWFVRVSALDPAGLEGLPRTYAFDRVLNTVAAGMGASGSGFERRYLFKWSGAASGTPQYRFQLARKDDPDRPLVDEPLGTTRELAVTSLPPGEYGWRVLSLVPHGAKVIASWSGEQAFEVAGRK